MAKLGTVQLRLFVKKKKKRGHVDIMELLKELGSQEEHVLDEQDCTNLRNWQQCQKGHNTALTTPNTRQL